MIARILDNNDVARAHIRPFSPSRDLGDLATLIEIAFGPELVMTESDIVRDMRQMALWGPMLRLTDALAPLFSGYVWMEGSELVGNVSLNPERDALHTWTISNVAVLPEFRGQGIAGQLVDTAIDRVRRHGGRQILLQVRANNQPAIALYEHRGFYRFDVIHELGLDRHDWPLSLASGEARLRPVRLSEGRALYQLVVASTPREVLRRRPLRAERFRRGLGWLLRQYVQVAFSGQQCIERVGEAGGELAAYGSVMVSLLRGPYELELAVRPAERGQWERPLLEGLLQALQPMPHYRIQARVSASHPEALQTLAALGFKTLRVLDQMALDLG